MPNVSPLDADGIRRLANTGREHAARRSEVCDGLAARTVAFDIAVALAAIEPAVANLNAATAIAAIPGWTRSTATALLERNDVPTNAKLRWFNRNKRRRGIAATIAGVVTRAPGTRPELPDGWPLFGNADWLE